MTHPTYEVFAFVALRPCGCVCQAAAPTLLADMMKNKHFRAEMNAGRVKSVMSREEWMALPWKCAACKDKS